MHTRKLVVAAVGLSLVAFAAFLALMPNDSDPVVSSRAPSSRVEPTSAGAATPPAVSSTPVDPEPTAPGSEPAAGALSDEEGLALPLGFTASDPAVAWAQVDLEAVRRALPENRYWAAHMPTRDASVLEERERDKRYWREQRTRVESGNASEEEVDGYFEHRLGVFSDGVEFTSYLIDHYGDVLTERDLGLLQLTRRLHQARLVELPREHARAQQRRERHEEARRQWRAQQAAFADLGEDEAEAPAATPE